MFPEFVGADSIHLSGLMQRAEPWAASTLWCLTVVWEAKGLDEGVFFAVPIELPHFVSAEAVTSAVLKSLISSSVNQWWRSRHSVPLGHYSHERNASLHKPNSTFSLSSNLSLCELVYHAISMGS
jgi:hypothetical protein